MQCGLQPAAPTQDLQARQRGPRIRRRHRLWPPTVLRALARADHIHLPSSDVRGPWRWRRWNTGCPILVMSGGRAAKRRSQPGSRPSVSPRSTPTGVAPKLGARPPVWAAARRPRLRRDLHAEERPQDHGLPAPTATYNSQSAGMVITSGSATMTSESDSGGGGGRQAAGGRCQRKAAVSVSRQALEIGIGGSSGWQAAAAGIIGRQRWQAGSGQVVAGSGGGNGGRQLAAGRQ
ncbi:hypothetical protein GH733_009443 [Mirounga leonina]|nr:hypothetical protein GH733_009443 [Mirounga leonina]